MINDMRRSQESIAQRVRNPLRRHGDRIGLDQCVCHRAVNHLIVVAVKVLAPHQTVIVIDEWLAFRDRSMVYMPRCQISVLDLARDFDAKLRQILDLSVQAPSNSPISPIWLFTRVRVEIDSQGLLPFQSF